MIHHHFSHTLIFLFFFNDPATTEIYTLSLHDALPISARSPSSSPTATSSWPARLCRRTERAALSARRSEDHTSELQSHVNLVCRLLLEKKKKKNKKKKHVYNEETSLPLYMIVLIHYTT